MQKRLLGLSFFLVSSFGVFACTQAPQQPSPAAETSSAPGLVDDHFTYKEVSPGVWQIDDQGLSNIYLVTGTTKALLIDSGQGKGNLLKTVREITALPVSTVITHGHPDHACGRFQFELIYGSAKDIELMDFFCTAPNQPTINPVKTGSHFDLGDRTIEVLEQPGHTAGSIVLLDKANKMTFTGDNNNILVWLYLGHSKPLKTYQDSLKRMNTYINKNEINIIYPGHDGPNQPGLIADQIACIDAILNQQCTGEPYTNELTPYSGQLCNSQYAPACQSAQIVFDPKNLWEKP